MIDRVENIRLPTVHIYTPEHMHVFLFTHKLIISSPDSACPLNKKNRNIGKHAKAISINLARKQPRKYTPEERRIRILRFLEKRKKRNWSKKVTLTLTLTLTLILT